MEVARIHLDDNHLLQGWLRITFLSQGKDGCKDLGHGQGGLVAELNHTGILLNLDPVTNILVRKLIDIQSFRPNIFHVLLGVLELEYQITSQNQRYCIHVDPQAKQKQLLTTMLHTHGMASTYRLAKLPAWPVAFHHNSSLGAGLTLE